MSFLSSRFERNHAVRGGAIYFGCISFEENALQSGVIGHSSGLGNRIQPRSERWRMVGDGLHFSENAANKGGALFLQVS